jgi:serine/threonine-protein kinase
VEIYETGEDSGRHFIAMEYVEGRTFAEWRKSGPPLRRQVRVLAAVARAVQHAHDHGVLHRDLKPKNLLVDVEERPFVLDFGLARPIERDADTSGVICGTAAYMSPEQAMGAENLDGRADVYSIGVLLYEVLSGKTPFEGADRREVLRRVREGAVAPPGGLARAKGFPNVDAAIQSICRKAMAAKREDRFPDAAALAVALEGWLQPKEGRAETGSRAASPGRKRALLLGGGLAAAIALAVLAVAAVTPATGDRAAPCPRRASTNARSRSSTRRFARTRLMLARGRGGPSPCKGCSAAPPGKSRSGARRWTGRARIWTSPGGRCRRRRYGPRRCCGTGPPRPQRRSSPPRPRSGRPGSGSRR